MPEAVLQDIRRQMRIGAWNGAGALYGTRAQVREARRLLRRALAGKVDRLQFLDDRMLHLAETFTRPLAWITGFNLSRTLALLRPVYGLMQGIPTDHPLASTYWRKRTPPPASMDPDRDGCGLLWCSPVSPASGNHAARLTRLTADLLPRHGFEPMISLTTITDRALACVISISFDRDVAGEDERALACSRELLRNLAAEGYYSYRLSIGAMPAMAQPDSYSGLLTMLKKTLDPNGILAPGRYIAMASKVENERAAAARVS
jgi:4-cresol dehydrogenase (hydroxylating)